MVLFFFGQNDYMIARKVRELKDKYLAKAGGDLNLVEIDGVNLKFEDFSRQIMAMPLLSSSRLIIVEGIFKNKDKKTMDQIKDSLDKVSSSTVLLFVERGNPDRRLGIFRALNKPKIAQEFKAIEPYKMVSYIKAEAKERGCEIAPNAAQLLADFVGDNLWRLSNELDKLASYASNKIEAKDVEEMVEKNIASNIFAMIDDLSHAKQSGALRHLNALFSANEPPLRILALINYQFRTIVQVKEAMEISQNQYEISKITRLSPFQVSKTLSQARNFTFQDLSRIYTHMARVDFEIKTGKIEDREGLKDLVLAV